MGFTCNSLEIQPFEVTQLCHQILAKNGNKSDPLDSEVIRTSKF